MPRSLPKKLLLGVTHLIALGLGAWWASQEQPPETTEIAKPSNSPSSAPRYRISTSRLHEAFKFSSAHYKEAFPRKESPSRLSGGDRAALVTDFAGELQKHVDTFNQTGFTDYRYTQAIISRWMSLDPEAAMLFIGRIKLRSGWGDPWPALFKNPSRLDGLQLFNIIEDSWHPYNRTRGLTSLAPRIGERSPDHLSTILPSLSSSEAQQFFSKAVGHAKASDLNTWLEAIATLPDEHQDKAFASLTQAIIPANVPATWLNPDASVRGPTPATLSELNSLVARNSGTPVGDILQGRLDALVAKFQKQSGPGNTSPSSPKTTSPSRNEPGSKYWLMTRNAHEFQQVFTNQLPLASALQNQLTLIDDQVPQELQQDSIRQLISEALFIDPAQTLSFAEEHLSPNEVKAALDSSLHDYKHRLPPQQIAKVYSAIIDTPHWKKDLNTDSRLASLIGQFHDYHADLAADWIRSLPPEITDSVLGSTSGKSVRPIIEEARSK